MRHKPRRLTVIFLIFGAVLLIAGGTLAVATFAGATWLPWSRHVVEWARVPVGDLDPPDSLEALATDYPELAGLLTDPELGSVYKDFLVAYQEGGMAEARALAEQRGLLTPDGESLRVTLVLDVDDPAPLVAQLEAVGVQIVTAYRDRINIAVPVALVEQALQSDDAGEVFGRLTELEHVIAVRLPDQLGSDRVGRSDRQSIEGEGVGVIGADAWHAAGYTGKGVRVGVLDLGFAGYGDLLGDELPDKVVMETFGWYDEEEVHGAACAEIVHEVAPDAELFFAWYDGSDAAMGQAVDWLLAQDVDIITHSAGGVLDPRDGSGWSARLVDQTVAKGVVWVNSAGNEADVHYRDTYADADGDDFHDFGPRSAVLPIYVQGYVRVYLVWDDSWDHPNQDLELVLLDDNEEVIATSEDTQDGGAGQQPAEWIATDTSGKVIYAAVYGYDVTRPVTFDLFALGPSVEVAGATPAYSVGSPGDAASALTVGAVDWYDDTLALYSSQGPTADERLKPEISAPTGVSGATYGRVAFDGTSASAPHVAGAAALVLEAHPDFTQQEVVDLLESSAVDLGPSGPDTGYGFGRLALPASPAAMVPLPTPTPAATEDQPAATAAPQVTATAVAFATPEPDNSGSAAGAVILFGLVVGGLGLGGGGLLLLGGVLLVVDRRRRRRQPTPVGRAPVPPPARWPTPQGTGIQGAGGQWTGEQQPAPPSAGPPARHDAPPAAAGKMAATQMWLGPSSHPGSEPAVPQDAPQDAPAPQDAQEPVGASDHCPVCGAHLRPGARFCAACGSAIAQPPQHVAPSPGTVCQHCGAPLRPGSKFCAKCGHPTDA